MWQAYPVWGASEVNKLKVTKLLADKDLQSYICIMNDQVGRQCKTAGGSFSDERRETNWLGITVFDFVKNWSTAYFDDQSFEVGIHIFIPEVRIEWNNRFLSFCLPTSILRRTDKRFGRIEPANTCFSYNDGATTGESVELFQWHFWHISSLSTKILIQPLSEALHSGSYWKNSVSWGLNGRTSSQRWWKTSRAMDPSNPEGRWVKRW